MVSVYLRDLLGRLEGAPPPVDLAAERRNGDCVRNLVFGERGLRRRTIFRTADFGRRPGRNGRGGVGATEFQRFAVGTDACGTFW